MKLRSSILALLVVAAVLIGAYYPKYNNKEKEGLIMYALLNILEQVHFKPKDINDEFSKKVFDQYIEYVDGAKRFLTQAEIDQMKQFETQIDDQAKNQTFEFFDMSVQLIDQGVTRAKGYFDELIDSPFDLYSKETIEFDSEKREFVGSEADLKERWRKLLKYEVVSKVEKALDEQEEALKKQKENEDKDPDELTGFDKEKFATVEIKDISTLEKEAREEVKKTFGDWFGRLKKLRRSDRFETYLNTFTHMFDPHSDYFNPKEKQDFDITMGGKLEGIGARLSPDGNYIKVVTVVPGGPAWKGKELEVDDLIMGVTQKGGDYVDVFGMHIDDVVSMIRGKKGTDVILKVKKKEDESIVDIEIERDEVIIDESFARSVILDLNEDVTNIGYIKLPKFYSSFEGNDGNSCAIDVQKELDKLKKNNVNGIILDLRYNGGGSLPDVVNMSGLFIEDGPIVQVKPRNGKPYVYEDKDDEVHYNGPLIVMVNSYSASASEILAAALQDYDRALIVGSNSTFGKGTVQRFFNLDRAIRGNRNLKPLGEIKLTMQKFYRVNGGSTQLKGVTPDIILPDRFSYMDIGEKEYDSPMAWSEINSLSYGQDIYQVRNKAQLRTKSETRIAADETFGLIHQNALRLKTLKDESEYPLSLDDYIAKMDEREVEAAKYDGVMKDNVEGLVIRNLSEDLEDINSDESKVARNDDWIKGMSKDKYIEETLLIMRDMLKPLQ